MTCGPHGWVCVLPQAAVGQGMPSSPATEQKDSTARDQIPQKQEELVLAAATAATLPVRHVPCSSVPQRFPGRSICLELWVGTCAAIGLRVLWRWELGGDGEGVGEATEK